MAVRDGVVILLASFSLVTGTVTNVAVMKHAWMSSKLDQWHPASKAVDGDTRAYDFSHIVHTGTGQTTAWWKVDLQTPVQSARVILYFRTDYIPRRNGVHLYTSGTNSSEPTEGNLCHTVTGRPDGTDIPDVLNVTCPGTWRYLTVYTETNNTGGGVILDFAEVQVWICVDGKYGPSCARDCSSRQCMVSSSTCDDITGTCPAGGCQGGWMGPDCSTECSTRKYGANCAKDCSSRRCKTSSSICNRISGACPDDGCEDGWMGVDCTAECTSGKYGANCAKDCISRHCKTSSTTCDRFNGACSADRCKDGWMGVDCTRDCQDGYYGQNCSLKCADRHCTSASCPGDGACSAECEPGWTLRDCTQASSSVVKIGVIGGAIGMAVMLLLVVGLIMCLLKHGRLKWIPSNRADPKEGRKTGYTEEIPTHTPTPGLGDPDYTELNDVTREREEKSQYDVIQNQVYENN